MTEQLNEEDPMAASKTPSVDKYHGVISLSQDDALQPNVVCQICLTLCNSLAARQSSSGEPERKGCDCGR